MAIEKFLYACKEYVEPEYVSEQEGYFVYGKMFLSYSDNSGNDKPKIVTQNMIDNIQNGIKKFYIGNCEDCGKELPITRVVCKECANV